MTSGWNHVCFDMREVYFLIKKLMTILDGYSKENLQMLSNLEFLSKNKKIFMKYLLLLEIVTYCKDGLISSLTP